MLGKHTGYIHNMHRFLARHGSALRGHDEGNNNNWHALNPAVTDALKQHKYCKDIDGDSDTTDNIVL